MACAPQHAQFLGNAPKNACKVNHVTGIFKKADQHINNFCSLLGKQHQHVYTRLPVFRMPFFNQYGIHMCQFGPSVFKFEHWLLKLLRTHLVTNMRCGRFKSEAQISFYCTSGRQGYHIRKHAVGPAQFPKSLTLDVNIRGQINQKREYNNISHPCCSPTRTYTTHTYLRLIIRRMSCDLCGK